VFRPKETSADLSGPGRGTIDVASGALCSDAEIHARLQRCFERLGPGLEADAT